MFLCARKRCRDRCLPNDDKNVKDLPRSFEVQYILNCGHSICEKCLYMIVESDKRSFCCDQCSTTTTFSARAFTSIKEGNLSTSSNINRLNKEVPKEIPIDAYSFGLAFCEGQLKASPVINDGSPEPVDMEDSKEDPDEENIRLKSLVPPARRLKLAPLISVMHTAVSTHAECGKSLKFLGTLEKQLAKEFYEAKMQVRDDFQILHSLLQLEEMKGISQFEDNYKRRKEEFHQVERHLVSIRNTISEVLQQEHESIPQITKKRNQLRELNAKPCRISLSNYEVADEFKYDLDDYLKTILKDSLTLKNVERATTLALEPQQSSSSSTTPSVLFRSPPNHIHQIPAPGLSPDSTELVAPAFSQATALPTSAVTLGVREVIGKLGAIFSPHHFYITLWEDEDKIRRMMAQIERWCTRTHVSPPPVNSLKPGTFIFAYYDDVSRWVRGRILTFDCDSSKALRKRDEYGKSVPSAHLYYSSISVEVQLLDYGGIEKISYSKLRVPFEELFDKELWPYLAIKCYLENTAPRSKEWDPNAVTVMTNFCKDYKLRVEIFSIEDGLHRVNLRHAKGPDHTRNNISIREILILGHEACYCREHEPASTNFDYMTDTEFIRFDRPERIPIKRQETILITSLTNPDLFYVTRYSDQEQFLRLHESLKIYFDLEDDEPYIVYVPRKGQPCVALDEGAFYRAEIVKLIDAKQVQVQFVDFGTLKIVDVANLRLIREEFLRPRIYAIPCKLAHIGPIGFNWSDMAVTKFQDLCFGGPTRNSYLFNLSVIDYDLKGKHVVNLRRYTGTEYLSVNVSLVKMNYALSTGPLTDMDSTSISEYDDKFDDRIFKAVENLDVNGYDILKELHNRNEEAQSSLIDSYIKIRVSHSIDPDEFYIQILTPEVRSYFICFENKMSDDFHSKLDDPVPSSLSQFELSECVVFAHVSEFDVKWRRGIIEEKKGTNVITKRIMDDDGRDYNVYFDRPETEYTVRARDYGYKLSIPRKLIFKLSQDSKYIKDGDFCLRCHLNDITPAGSCKWTQTAIEEFNELLLKFQRDLYLHVPGNLAKVKPVSLPVDIIAKENYIPNAYAPTQLKYHSFRSMLVSRGLARPLNNIDIGELEDNPENHEYPPVRSDLFPFTGRKEDSVLGYIRNARAAVHRKIDTSIVRYYKDAEKPKENTFIAIATDVTPDLKIWFRIQRMEGTPLINIVNRGITKALKEQDQLIAFSGEELYCRACTAIFDFDKTWNRAEILYSLGEEQTYVHFVDYGNDAAVNRSNISAQVFYPEIPKLAQYAYLSNFKSHAEGNKVEELRWQIHKLIVDQKCVFKWTNSQSRTEDMKVKIVMPDGVDLVQHLVKNSNLVSEVPDEPKTPPRSPNPSEKSS